MNILFVHERAVPGGAETRLLMHARSLASRGHRIFSACSPGLWAGRFRQAGFEVLDLGPRWPSAGGEEVGALRRLIRQHEIAFCDVHASLSLWPGGLAALCEGTPFALNLHGLHGDDDRVLLRTALSVLMPWAAWTAVNAASTQDYFAREFGVPVEALRCVPNAVDDVLLGQLPPAEDPPRRLLLLSRLDGDKLPSLNAAARFVLALTRSSGGLSLRVAGGGDAAEVYRREWGPRFSQAGVRVEWVGPTERAEEEIGRADLVLGLGRVALEGMAARRPVVLCGVQGNLAGLCRREGVDHWFASNLNGRNAGDQDEGKVVDELRRFPRHEAQDLARWVSERAGGALLGAWARDVEAAAGQPLSPAARSAGDAARALFGDYRRVLERGWELERRLRENEQGLQECATARAADRELFRRRRVEVADAGHELIRRYYLLLESLRTVVRVPPRPIRILQEFRRLRGEHAPEMRRAIERFRCSVNEG